MISIRCSQLEAIRNNPAAYGQLLATGEGNSSGSRGMFDYFKDVARLVHLGELTVNEGIKELQGKFLGFNVNVINKARQEKLIEKFVSYCKHFEANAFVFTSGNKRMKWDIIKDSRLSGNTPWVVANEDAYYSYILIEKDIDWENELRFPLFQQYLAEQVIECSADEIKVGIYSLPQDKFAFRTYGADEIERTLLETKEVFKIVAKEYSKLKSK